MIEFDNTALVVTARMASAALPGRPMMDVNGKPLILRAWAQATASNIGHVLVAAGENRIAETVRSAGGDALVVPRLLKAEADQIAAVLALRDPARRFQYVISLPAHLLAIQPLSLRRCLAGLMNLDVEIVTMACAAKPGTAVKVVAPLDGERELAYVRDLVQGPVAEGELELIGIYAYRRAALEKFAALPVSPREKAGAPELLRALAHDMKLVAVKVDRPAQTVDTPEDLEALRRLLKA